MLRSLSVATTLLSTAYSSPLLSPRWSLPVVDLGYELHQAISYNEAVGYYNFSNIPFAAPPVGDLRFQAPRPPVQADRSKPNNGGGPKICPQGNPGWGAVTYPFFLQYAELLATGNTSLLNSIPVLNESQVAAFAYKPQAGESEDCLYLDIMVPNSIFNGQKKSPVLVEIYGGGYVAGDKVSVSERSSSGSSAAGLIARGNSSFIYIAINYRLGAFGFSAGPEFECAGGNSNAGLLDQRAALEWVQKYIHLFGGDANQVTVIGESAGAGSIQHQITAFGGKRGSVPFQRAIPQSPGFTPVRWNNKTNSAWEGFLKYANASSFKQLQSLPSEVLMLANAQQNFLVPPVGGYVYGPVVDGSFVPDLTSILFAQGNFDKNVQILAGQNRREGYLFTNPLVRTDDEIVDTLMAAIGAPHAAAQYVVSTLYPANYDGSLGYSNWYERISTIVSEFAFICNDYYMLSATASQSYGYLFNIFPGYHGQDIPYTFFDGVANASNVAEVQNANAALTLQGWITSFALGSAPTTHVTGSPNLPLYDSTQQIGALNGAQAQFQAAIVKNPAANPRCAWWQQGLYAPDSDSAIVNAVKGCTDCGE